MASEDATNRGLGFELDGLRGYVVDSRVNLGEDRQRRTRITFRLIETVGGGPPRMERYLESETTRSTEPFGTQQTVRRERVRTLVGIDGLRPISSRGEVSVWTDQGWRSEQHDIRFEGDRALGVITDSTGRGLEVDRLVPSGILLRDVRDLAFATLQVDSLVGRSVEFTTFDPRTGEIVSDRYDVLGADTIEVAGEQRSVLRVNVASGLMNEIVFFERRRPRVALRRVSQDGASVEDIIRVEVMGRPGGSRD
jgi:hypothetical protein